MSLLSPAHAEEVLVHLAQQFAQWRQSRTTPHGCIPKALWAQAVTLCSVLPLTRVAKQLGLTSHALKRRSAATGGAPIPTPLRSRPFVEVQALPWRVPTTAEVEVQRPDGTRLRITYNEASPALVPLLQTFLDAR